MKIVILWVYFATCIQLGSTLLSPGWLPAARFNNEAACNIKGQVIGDDYRCAEVGVWPPYDQLSKKVEDGSDVCKVL